jgi:ribosomal protein S18 acetylase RimI-like enzyme
MPSPEEGSNIELRRLGPADAAVLDRVAADVFDGPVVPALLAEFLADPRHHLIVALSNGIVVGMITAVDYVHPDKPAQLWINEVGVAPSHQRRGIGRALLCAMRDYGRERGWAEAWLGTEHDNVPARGLYEDAGSVGEPFLLYSFDLSRPTTAPAEK